MGAWDRLIWHLIKYIKLNENCNIRKHYRYKPGKLNTKTIIQPNNNNNINHTNNTSTDQSLQEECSYEIRLKCDAHLELPSEVEAWEVALEPLKLGGKCCVSICCLIFSISEVYVDICCAIYNLRAILSSCKESLLLLQRKPKGIHSPHLLMVLKCLLL